VNGRLLGEVGQLHPDVVGQRKFKQEVWIGYIDLEKLLPIPLREPRYQRMSRFPSVERDFSLLLDNSVSYARLQAAIEDLRIPEVISIEPRELFRGGTVPQRRYSLLMQLIFQSSERTLRDDEVAAWSQQVIAAIQPLGVTLRT